MPTELNRNAREPSTYDELIQYEILQELKAIRALLEEQNAPAKLPLPAPKAPTGKGK